MLRCILTHFDVDAVLFCERNVQWSTQVCLFKACLSALHETWDSPDVENCQLTINFHMFSCFFVSSMTRFVLILSLLLFLCNFLQH